MKQSERPSANQILVQSGCFLKNLVLEFFQKDCQKSAAALTYMALFALVPVMTVTYSMVSIFPVFEGIGDQIQQFVFKHFVPETGSEIQKYLAAFSQQARNLTLPGIVILIVTAYLMLSSIEKTFNDIWNVKRARSGLMSFLIYWAIMSIGPLLLGAGLIMSTTLLSHKLVVGDVDVIDAIQPVFQVVPFFMSSAGLILLFVAVPNCHVPFRAAVAGGVLTAICIELAKLGFGAVVINSNYQLIYGAFAAVPLFLFWVYSLWIIVLMGAVFVKKLSEMEYQKTESDATDMIALLRCLDVFQQKARAGEQVNDADCLNTGVDLDRWHKLKELMIDQNWISSTASGRYVLSRDLKYLTLWHIAQITNMPINTHDNVNEHKDWEGLLQRIQLSINTQAKDVMSISLYDLLNHSPTKTSEDGLKPNAGQSEQVM